RRPRRARASRVDRRLGRGRPTAPTLPPAPDATQPASAVRAWHDLADVDPLVQRLAAGTRLGRDVRGELERALARGDVDHEPAGHEVVGRVAGGHRPDTGPAVAHPRPLGRERLAVDVL